MAMLFRKLILFLLIGAGLALSAYSQSERVPLPIQPETYFWTHPSSQGIQPADVAGLQLSSQHIAQPNGIHHLYYQQTHLGIPVRGAMLHIHLDAKDSLLHLTHSLVSKLASRATATSASLTPISVIQTAADSMEVELPSVLIPNSLPQEVTLEQQFSAASFLPEPITLSLAYLDLGVKMPLCWHVDLPSPDGAHRWQVWIDAQNGQIHEVRDAVIHCEFPHDAFSHPHDHDCEAHEAHGADFHFSPNRTQNTQDGSSYRVYSYPVESPNHGGQSLVFAPADSLASPFGWHDVNGAPGPEYTRLRGNNVWAQEDRFARNDGSGFSPEGGLGLDFDFTIDETISLVEPINQSAAITNLFYWNNFTHDVMYHYGFDEAAGNFQTNNYGRGGIGGDFIFADAQDGSGVNNANFFTPRDGDNARMQMFLWNVTDFLLTLESPASLAGTYPGSLSLYGETLDTAIRGELVLARSANDAHYGCDSLINGPELAGKIAVFDRGNCTFVSKVLKAQSWGAKAVIIVQFNQLPPFPMGGDPTGIDIPAIMISRDIGAEIQKVLDSSETVSGELLDQGPAGGFDSDLDAGIIVHEYGHGISIRLTGGANVNTCLFNPEQAGEGWSDWYGLALTHRPGDTRDQPRGIATYVQGQETAGQGIRSYPYSTDMSINPMTYDDIRTGSIPHGVGSVMSTMLWDMYWDLIDVYGYDPDLINGNAGNQIAIQLVTDGLKLQTCQPGFVDVRDAILKADQLNYGGANQCTIWKSFARRGLGYSADQGVSGSSVDGTSAFDLPPQCLDTLFLGKNASRVIAERGDTLVYELITSNRTGSLQTDVIVRDTLPEGLQFVGGLAGCPITHDDGVITVNFGASTNLNSDTCRFEVVITEDAPQSTWISRNTLESETDTAGFQIVSLTGTDGWQYVDEGARSGQHAFFVPNVGALNDQVLRMPKITPQKGTILSFWHRYDTEFGFDGGFVEFKIPGSEWLDLRDRFVLNGYNAGIATNNPARARLTFGGDSEGYIESWIDLTDFATTEMDIRFRFASDDNTSSSGWWIDDISLLQAESFTNSACLSSAQGATYCNEQPQPTYLLPIEGATSIMNSDVPSTPQMQVYPNPTRNQVSIRLREWPAGPIEVRLETLLGATVLSQQAVSGADQELTVSWDRLPAGMYLLRVLHPEHRAVERLVVRE